jgi:RNA polymerase sigma-70 factor (ECF subfamily)
LSGELDPALDAARRGEEWGVACLWAALNPPLERYLYAMVGQSAQDVASETWLQAARDLPGFRGDAAGVRVWLFRMARNRAVDELRRAGRRREDLVAEPSEVSGVTAPDAAEQAEERLGTARALALVAALPPDQAEAVLLRVVAGLDAMQCGRILGKRAGTVRVAAMRGLRKLAEALAAEPQASRESREQASREHAGGERDGAAARAADPAGPAGLARPAGPAGPADEAIGAGTGLATGIGAVAGPARRPDGVNGAAR